MNINQATVDLVKQFEGLRLAAYRDAIGVWTIGYGTTAVAGLGVSPAKGMSITQLEAEWFLKAGLLKFAAEIEPLFQKPLTENEFGACLSLAYNIGPGSFSRSSVLRFLNQGNKAVAATKFVLWNKAGGRVLAGLTRRRSAETKLFLTP